MQRAGALTRKCGNAKKGLEQQQFFRDGTIQGTCGERATESLSSSRYRINLIDHIDHLSPRMAQIVALEQSIEPDELQDSLFPQVTMQQSRYYAPVMTVEVPGIGEDIGRKSWFRGTFCGKSGKRMWQHMWQGVKDVN